MTVDQTAQLMSVDLLNQQQQQQKRHIRYRLFNNSNRSLSMSNVPSQVDSPAVIVAYQDVTAESSALLTHSEVDLAIRPEMEESFCSNFVCCGQYLPDLHALLQHYEDCHVRFEASQSVEVMDDYGRASSAVMQNGNNMETDESVTAGVLKKSPRHGKRRRLLAVELEQCDYLTDDTNVVSAFDNTVLRTITAPIDQAYHGAMLKRSQSVPAGINYSRLSNLSGNLNSESPMEQYRFIHSILSATVDSADHHLHEGRHYPPMAHSNNNHNTSTRGDLQSASNSFSSSSHLHQSYLSAFEKGDRPYICPVQGCGKAYKNPNGLKYHEKHGHDSASENVERPHRCSVSGCGKRYKNPNGLKYHMAHAHPNFVRHLSNAGIGLSSASTRYSTPSTSSSQQSSSAVAVPPPLYR